MGVYQIKNKANGKLLIGYSIDLIAILNRHRAELKMGSHRNKVLQKEWLEFGPDMFEFEQLEILEPSDNPVYEPLDDLRLLEELWIEKLSFFLATRGITNLQKLRLDGLRFRVTLFQKMRPNAGCTELASWSYYIPTLNHCLAFPSVRSLNQHSAPQ